MLSKISLGISAILLIAVIILSVKVFSGEPLEQPVKKITKNAETMPVTSKIAFIKADSINANYLFIKEKSDALVREEKQIQTTLENKLRALEKRYMELQQKAATMNQQEMEAAQVELQQGQQEIEALRFNLSNDLAKKRDNLQKEFFEKVNAFLAEYNKQQNFDYILSYAEGGSVLLARDTLDITSDVLNGLNADYNNSKKK